MQTQRPNLSIVLPNESHLKVPSPIGQARSILSHLDWYSFSLSSKHADCFSNASLDKESIRTHRIPLFRNPTNPLYPVLKVQEKRQPKSGRRSASHFFEKIPAASSYEGQQYPAPWDLPSARYAGR